jgi:hypothetical protein
VLSVFSVVALFGQQSPIAHFAPNVVYIQRVEPVSLTISVAASQILKLVDWKEVFNGLVGDATREGAKGFFRHLKPNDREQATRQAIALFVEEWLSELEDKTPLSRALPGYRDQLKRLVEYAAPEIVEWMAPETKEVVRKSGQTEQVLTSIHGARSGSTTTNVRP